MLAKSRIGTIVVHVGALGDTVRGALLC